MTIGSLYQPYSYTSPYMNTGLSETGFTGRADAIGRTDASGKTDALGKTDTADKIDTPGKTAPAEECQTCKNRKYQDGSNENVSFKSAQHISPESAASAVRAHESEHVANAFDKASQKNGQVINASVSIHTSVCPECGRTYISGGVTNTTIKYPNESNPYQQQRKAQDAIKLKGANIDYAA